MTDEAVELVELERRLLGDVWTSPALWESVGYLCDACNGRFAGTDDERRAGDFLLERFREIGAENVTAETFEMNGWQRGDARLALLDSWGAAARDLPCLALPGSPAGRVEAEVVDGGPGTAADFERLGDAVAGKVVLADDTGPHRLEKYARSQMNGAVAFIFARTKPGMLALTGSLSLGKKPVSLPGIGVSLETASLVRRQMDEGSARVRVAVEGESRVVLARNILAELPGSDPDAGWIVACGHYDGHDIAQGAQDNATGTAVVLETARVLAPVRSHFKAGLRFILFSGEEFGVLGS
ncbi:MAG: M28 family peptidase, partial [Chloroflexi bacterium]|nr:M28 family peptidase [Chloroflexota bacterium]